MSVQHEAREDAVNNSYFTLEAAEPINAATASLHIHPNPIATIDENTPPLTSPDRPYSAGGYDGVGDLPPPATPSPSAQNNKRNRRRNSAASNLSLEGSMKGGRGIKIGAAKPIIGSSSDEGRRFSRLDS